MTVKDFKQQIAPYSTSELLLFELAIYQELEKRGVAPQQKEDEEILQQIKALNEGIEDGTTRLISLDKFKERLSKTA